ncbi:MULTISPECIES: helix-turn-helix domain-containing protein [Thioalkalivibrio]|uniref:Transcriptional regulator n=1 Tax=Thioalkalivibrio halophilus TaxID=252474 RepID=A0A1V2ZZ11_9GAMM|nr:MULTISPECIES: helix-turn-helix transcriptional regulator [Thioalkalivibrio]OOC10347.1 transcriptional regulator [Thioalkalivibrio halophilus]PYG02854.1 DNA-binding XRE family transcriptional regulator [Thioalkalivibrio sp. ALE21]
MSEAVQIIERDGKPEYAVVPIDTYERLVASAEKAEDIRTFDRAMVELERGEDEVVPEAVAQRLLAGDEHPMRVWREHRGLTQESLATAAGVGKSYISQLEAGSKSGSVDAMRRIAAILEVDIEDLLPVEP